MVNVRPNVWSASRSSFVSGTAGSVRYSVRLRRLVWLCTIFGFDNRGSKAKPVQLKISESLLFAEELFTEVGNDRVRPDQLDPLLGQVGAHEVARADADVAIAEL